MPIWSQKKLLNCMNKLQTNNSRGIIVLGGHVQALGIIRILGGIGLTCVIIDITSKNIARHSKYCKVFHTVSDDNLLSFLIDMGLSNIYNKWLVFPTNDFHVKLLSQNKTELSKYFTITTDDWDKIEVFYNKINTYKLAQNLNIPIAKTFFPNNESELKNIDVIFPCIIKPAIMHNFYSKVKKKVFICNNFEELVKNYRKAIQFIRSDEIIVQDIIKGPSKNQYSACYLFIQGKAYVSLTAIRMRQHPIDFGNATTYAETVDMPIIKKYAEKILKNSNYCGLCEVEFKKDETDGQYKFLEVNTRTWKWHSIAEKANTPFLKTYYDYLIGNSITPINGQENASFRHALTDIPIQIILMFKGYSYFLRKKYKTVNAVWKISDTKPWFFEKIYLLFFIKKR